MSKKIVRSIISSRQIEEGIHVPFHLIGRPQWFKDSIAEGVAPESAITVVNSLSDLCESQAWLKKRKVLGLDSETGGENKRDGLDPVAATSRMLIFQLGTPEMVYLIEPALVPDFKEILESEDHLFLAQNGVHDFKFMFAKYGIHYINYKFNPETDLCEPCFYDTMLAEQLITAGLYGVTVGLEELAERYHPHRLISKLVRKEFIDMRGVLEYRHLYYAARDVYLLFAIHAAQQLEIKKHPGMYERMQLEFCAVAGTADAELTGFVLDEVRINATLDYWKKKASIIKVKVTKLYNDVLEKQGKRRNFVLPDVSEEFDLDSASQKLIALRKMGFELDDTKRETLQALDSEITDLLGEYSECTKIISTYGEGLLKRRSRTTGRLHPEFNQLGSGDMEARKGRQGKATTIATGRWSSDAQQFPRPDHILDPIVGEDAESVKLLFAAEYNKALEVLNKPEEASDGTK